MNQSQHPTIILGGGFTGLFTALHLSQQHYSQPTILIDQKERFTFNPLLYEFLSGEMADDQVWPRYTELLQGSDLTFVQGTVKAIDLNQRQVELTSGLRYTYSHLVLALGSCLSYFGIEGAKEHSFSFRTGEQAVALTKHLRECLQQAINTDDPQQRQLLTSVAVVGAGPSGVELAATLADLLPNWYRELGGDPQDVRVVILDQDREILNGNNKSGLRDTAAQALSNRKVSVELMLGAKVCRVHEEGLDYQGESEKSELRTATVVWTAGTTTLPLIKDLPIPDDKRDRHGRLCVTPTLQLLDYPEVFAGGDCAAVAQDPLPPTAQVAYQQGGAIAHNLVALSQGKELTTAEVTFRGTLLKLGLGESAAHIFDRFEIKGKPGHLIRQATYLQLLPTPVHNWKATTEWLVDGVFHRYTPAHLADAVASISR